MPTDPAPSRVRCAEHGSPLTGPGQSGTTAFTAPQVGVGLSEWLGRWTDFGSDAVHFGSDTVRIAAGVGPTVVRLRFGSGPLAVLLRRLGVAFPSSLRRVFDAFALPVLHLNAQVEEYWMIAG